jgi:hypothetical protein
VVTGLKIDQQLVCRLEAAVCIKGLQWDREQAWQLAGHEPACSGWELAAVM